MTKILPVNGVGLQKQFVDYQESLHQGNKSWMKSSDDSDRAGFGSHPFYQNAKAQAFLAIRSDTCVGRIAAIDNQLQKECLDEKPGAFGFFECEDSSETARLLLAAAEGWLQQRQLNRMRGPISPSLNYSCGCQIDNFEELPTFGMASNPSYYPELLNLNGLVKAKDLLSFRADTQMLAELDPGFQRAAEQASKRFGITVRHFNFDKFEEDMKSYFKLFNQTIPGHWGAVKLSNAEMQHMAGGLKSVLIPKFTAMAEVQGRPVGAVLGVPDFNPLLKNVSDNLLPASWETDTVFRKQISRVRVSVALVAPEYNRWGVGPLMNWFLLQQVLADCDWNNIIKEVEYSWILEDNHLSRNTIERGGGKLAGRHRIFEKLI